MSAETVYPSESIIVDYEERGGGVRWRVRTRTGSEGVPSTEAATGWALDVGEARREALERGVATAVRWFNPRGLQSGGG